MKVAVVQLKSGKDKAQNIKKALCLVKCAVARKARLIALPEAFNIRAKIDHRRGIKEIAEDVPGPSLLPLMEMARTNKVVILAGTICERIPRRQKVYNTAVLINDSGHIVAKYRKMHLFDATIGRAKLKEFRNFLPGKEPTMAKIGPWKMGLSICYDVRFPELYQFYRKKNADILCVPSAFTKMTGQGHWEILLRARAIESRCYVLAPNQVGKSAEGVSSYGNSMIVGPWGKILARASGDQEEIIFADFKKTMIAQTRAILGP